MINFKKISLTLAVATALSFSGCGSSSSDTPVDSNNNKGKTITGIIEGNGYAKNDIINRFLNSIVTPAYAINLNSPDTIVVMYNNGESQKEFPINADGSFEIDTSLFNKNDLVILVVNKANKKVFGNLNLATNSDAKLDYFDKSKLTDNLALGTIDTENNCSSSTTLSNTSAFSNDDLEKLEKIAIADDAMVMSVNNFLSPGFGTEVLSYMDLGTKATMTNQFNDLSNFSKANNFNRNSFGFYGEGSTWKNTNYTNVKIYPPSSINYKTNRNDNGFSLQADANSPITSNYRNIDDGDNGAFFQFPAIDNFPTGNWIVKVAGSDDIKAQFIFAGIDAFDKNGKIKVPVPKIKISTDSSDIITAIEIKWYLYKDGTYIQASEDLLNNLAARGGEGAVMFECKYNNQSSHVRYGSDTTTWNTTIDFSNKNININDISQIHCSFRIGQVNYKYAIQDN